MRRGIAATAAGLLLVTLAACTPFPADGPLTLEHAKADYMDAQSQLRAAIPDDVVIEDLDSPQTASLLPCDDGKTYTWPGASAVVISPDTDTASLIDDIAAEWADRPGWTQRTSALGGGGAALDLFRVDGLTLGIAALEDNTQLMISGFSACFAMSDHDPLQRY
ncbi:hypothetical protein FBY40_1366 [Microbacterium sp. SLBN-154]|uniref:hypothetical protein n=1 Tax=Microbacterium sp. SLBN-154 TaxID=2768458 RepID=UPI0011509D7C|nr:hypothetical protein [Microbacterium sp. SLBN-154]TQK18877.1 hypothetical protein FBY40_1366 [Microbacterium sp. SLBN-154]